MSKAQTQQQAHTAQLEASKALFGMHPVDVIAPIKCGEESLAWMDSLLYAIEKLSSDANIHSRLHVGHLAGMGRYVAQEMCNYMGCEHETLAQRIEGEGGAA